MKFKQLPYHPFLFTLFPVLALLGNNISQVSVDVVFRPLFLAMAGTIVLFVALRLILRDVLKASLVTSLCLLLFFSYGQVYNLLKASPLAAAGLARHRLLIPVYVGLLITGLYLILRKHKHAPYAANQMLNLVGAVLLVFPLFQIGAYSFSRSTARAVSARGATASKQVLTSHLSIKPDSRPDVYYIILDGYSRSDVIQAELGFDNTPFLDQLRQLGFVIGDCSRSNYNATYTSLNSSLNLEQMPALYAQAAAQGIPADDVITFIQDSLVRRQFESLGYKIVAFDTGFEWTRLRDADLYLSRTATPLGVQSITPFEAMLVDSTMASVYKDWQNQQYQKKFAELAHPKSYFINQERFKFSELPKIADIAEPTFTFAHILIPHVPFVFSPEGILTDPGYFTGEKEAPVNESYFREGYIKAIRFDNEQILPILKTILEKSATPPIIVIQGDHGFGSNKFPILNAYYLPGEGKDKIYPTISPVNTFRVIFNTYFGGSYNLLPDQSFFDVGNEPPVPEIGPSCK